jgi:tRNA (cytidine/uridine-2'-O-)-methyltransferase
MNIVLVEPEIPQNTGNIARTCAVTGSVLHLVRPLGFEISDRYLKRAGLDYWGLLTYHIYEDFNDFRDKNSAAACYYASTKGAVPYTDVKYAPEDYLIFGSETKGLPKCLIEAVYDRCIRIPMREQARSLNLSNSVAIVLYEALRQNGFRGLIA